MHGGERGLLTVEFHDGQKINFSYPPFKVGGMIYGTRTIDFEGTITVSDPANGFTADVIFGPDKKKGFFRKQKGTKD
jgi:hypothetical protein